MPEQKKKSVSPLIFILVGIFVLVGLIGMFSGQKSPSPVTEVQAQETAVETAAAVPVPVDSGVITAAPTDDLAALTTPRILGNPSAPVKISEHSSFTCGACSGYHKTNFKTLKQDYIDTGKAYVVYDDFPRNEVDIAIGSLARCLSGDAYFNFIQLLFETQPDWVGPNYKTHIKQNAMIAGLSDAKAEECMNNKAVHEALAASRQRAQEKFNINSTPHLVINDNRVIPGLSPYEEIKAAIEEELAKKAAAPAPQ